VGIGSSSPVEHCIDADGSLPCRWNAADRGPQADQSTQTEHRWNENHALASPPNRVAPNPDNFPEVAARHEHLEPIGVGHPEVKSPAFLTRPGG
jgi:hypothetical protein